eukprot:TRINITY_DN9601_c0_g2_i1.p1 TRINITY_DN9601_c0_g2~~TRINITY_DN9601_c0_g2_i1.p1  ORF type:complete len:315 (+),score=29.97 TRINITY_DN9601_c0_g2_i1:56-1000(+)
MAKFLCEVCFEMQTQRLVLPRSQTGNSDVVRAGDCNHPVCQSCMVEYLQVRVGEQRVFKIRCPHEGCKNEILEEDVRRLAQEKHVSSELYEKFVDLRRRDYTQRARELTESCALEDIDSVAELYDSTRLCPRCSLIIQKSAGCNSFYCTCGHHFNYASAPRLIGNGVKNFSFVIRLARKYGLTICEAIKYGGDARKYDKVSRLASMASLSMEDAFELDTRARNGDSAAQGKIRELRRCRADDQASELEDLSKKFETTPFATVNAAPLGLPHSVYEVFDECMVAHGLQRLAEAGHLPKLMRHLTWPQRAQKANIL